MLCNNYLLAGGRGGSTGGGDGLWASLGLGKLGFGTGLDSVASCAFMEVPSRPRSYLGVSGPAGSILSLCTGGFRLDDGRT